jgi:hypothetical protein
MSTSNDHALLHTNILVYAADQTAEFHTPLLILSPSKKAPGPTNRLFLTKNTT